jgi:hypothetical protein
MLGKHIMTNQIEASFSEEMIFTCEEVVTGNRVFSATVSNSATSYGTSHKKALRFAVKHVSKLNFLQGHKLVREYFVNQSKPRTNLEKGAREECDQTYTQTFDKYSVSSNGVVSYYYDKYEYGYTSGTRFYTATCTCCPLSQKGTAQTTCKENANTCMTEFPANDCRCYIDPPFYSDCECTQ